MHDTDTLVVFACGAGTAWNGSGLQAYLILSREFNLTPSLLSVNRCLTWASG